MGTAALPDQTKCPPGTGSSVGSTVPCGNGAVGIDNLWHDSTAGGAEVPSGVNPMWHAKNLERGSQGDYLTAYGLDPVNDPTDRLTGTYARKYNSTLVSPWLWNAQKRVYMSTEDETSIAAKAKYVADKGTGGSDPPPGPCTAPAWNAASVYTGGQQVSHKGHTWLARWWTQNEEPGTREVWTDLAAC